MRTIAHNKGVLHVETPLGIINIRVGLTNLKGQNVESIEVVPDDYYGEKKVMLSGRHNTLLVQCLHVRNQQGKL